MGVPLCYLPYSRPDRPAVLSGRRPDLYLTLPQLLKTTVFFTMWQVFLRVVQRYSPWVFLPLTIPIGFVGFHFEQKYRGASQPTRQREKNTIEERYERQLKRLTTVQDPSNDRKQT